MNATLPLPRYRPAPGAKDRSPSSETLVNAPTARVVGRCRPRSSTLTRCRISAVDLETLMSLGRPDRRAAHHSVGRTDMSRTTTVLAGARRGARWVIARPSRVRDGLIDWGWWPSGGRSLRLVDVDEYEAGLAALEHIEEREREFRDKLDGREMPGFLRKEGLAIADDIHRVRAYLREVMPVFSGTRRDGERRNARRRRLARFIEGLER